MEVLWLLLIITLVGLSWYCTSCFVVNKSEQVETYNQYNRRNISDYTTSSWNGNSIWQVIGRASPMKPGFALKYDYLLEQDISRGPDKPSTIQGYLYRVRSPNGNYITLNGNTVIKQGEIRRVRPGSMDSEDIYFYKINLDKPRPKTNYWTVPYDTNPNMRSIYDFSNAVDFRTERMTDDPIQLTPGEIQNRKNAKTFLAIETKITDPDLGTYPRLRGNRFRYNKAERSTRPRIVLGMPQGVPVNSKRSCGGGDPYYSPTGKLLVKPVLIS
jgi:hypothetical protein